MGVAVLESARQDGSNGDNGLALGRVPACWVVW